MSNQTSNEFQDFNKGRNTARIFGGLVYAGVVLAATTLFISFVLTAFPDTAYFTRAIMVIGGLMIGGSMLAFPYALHSWAIGGTHRMVTIGLYYGEMAIIALNTVVSFAALLYKFSGAALPAWVSWYEPFSIVSIIYTLFAWGTIFLTDPASKARDKELQAQQIFLTRVAEKKLQYLDSIEGEEAVLIAANAEIKNSFKGRTNTPGHFGTARLSAPRPQTTSMYQSEEVYPADEALPVRKNGSGVNFP